MCARVLVIDDDPVNLDLMTYLLSAFGHAPIAASGAEPALQAIRTSHIDLVLCDIQMPGADGFEFLRLSAKRDRADRRSSALRHWPWSATGRRSSPPVSTDTWRNRS